MTYAIIELPETPPGTRKMETKECVEYNGQVSEDEDLTLARALFVDPATGLIKRLDTLLVVYKFSSPAITDTVESVISSCSIISSISPIDAMGLDEMKLRFGLVPSWPLRPSYVDPMIEELLKAVSSYRKVAEIKRVGETLLRD